MIEQIEKELELRETFNSKPTRLSPNSLRKHKGCEKYSDEEAEKVIDTLFTLSIIGYAVHEQMDSRIRDMWAIHQAGHTVAALYYKLPFESVSLDTTFKKIGLYPSQKDFKSKSAIQRISDKAKNIMLIDCAGCVAEKIHFGKVDEETKKDDIENLYRNSAYVIGGRNKAIIDCFEIINKLFSGDNVVHNSYWDAVIEIAEELVLLKEISHAHAETIFKRFISREIKQPRKK